MVKIRVRAGALGFGVALSLVLSGCATNPQEQSLIDSVVTALPHEVAQCQFVGNVDNDYISYTMQGARDNLRLKAAQLGANTLVETHLAVTPSMSYLYPDPWFGRGPYANTMSSPSFFLTGRAYLCPEGAGPKRATSVATAGTAIEPASRSGALSTGPAPADSPELSVDNEAAPAPAPAPAPESDSDEVDTTVVGYPEVGFGVGIGFDL